MSSAASPQISDAEWQVMKVLWTRSPRVASEIIDELAPTTGWKPPTIKTLLSRLTEKGAIAIDRSGKHYQYSPLFQEAECVRAESRSFLDRLFGGSITPMVANLIEGDQLSPEQIAALRKMLDSADLRHGKEPHS